MDPAAGPGCLRGDLFPPLAVDGHEMPGALREALLFVADPAHPLRRFPFDGTMYPDPVPSVGKFARGIELECLR